MNQNAIRNEGGLLPILNCCIIEDTNPLLKEWSLYAIRNLTLDNEQNQEFISSLKAEKISEKTKEEMAKHGLDIEIDSHGKIRVKKRD